MKGNKGGKGSFSDVQVRASKPACPRRSRFEEAADFLIVRIQNTKWGKDVPARLSNELLPQSPLYCALVAAYTAACHWLMRLFRRGRPSDSPCQELVEKSLQYATYLAETSGTVL